MRKKIFVLLSIFTLSACGNKQQENIIADVEPNQRVGELNYYVPSDYIYNPDLRGLVYTEDERKIYSSTDMDIVNDVIYIDAFVSSINTTIESYIENVNTNNLSDTDVKFILTNNQKIDVYERAGYIFVKDNVERINYAYITYKNNKLYTVTLSGPRTMEEDVKSIAQTLLASLSF